MSGIDEDNRESIVVKMHLQEDIAAELEAMILCSRLGFIKEARQIVDQALWRHLHFFPVFAEVAVFMFTNYDRVSLDRLRNKMMTDGITFSDEEAAQLCEDLFATLALFDDEYKGVASLEKYRSREPNLASGVTATNIRPVTNAVIGAQISDLACSTEAHHRVRRLFPSAGGRRYKIFGRATSLYINDAH